MTISLITPTLNSAGTLSRTLSSVAAQTYPVIEYLLIDGGSQDETLAVARKFSPALPLQVVSEPDQGIYDAMNKGIRRASGDVIGILNADDHFYDNEVLAKVAAAFASDPQAELVYGDIVYEADDRPGQVRRYWRTGEASPAKIRNGWTMPHPAVFVRRSLYQRGGLFNDSFRLAGDYEIMLRWLLVQGAKAVYLPAVLTVMSTGGASGRSWRQRRLGWRELRRAWRENKLSVPPFFIFRRLLFKSRQLWSRPEKIMSK